MWISVALAVLAAWCLASVPLALIVGRFISGPSAVAASRELRRVAVAESHTATTA